MSAGVQILAFWLVVCIDDKGARLAGLSRFHGCLQTFSRDFVAKIGPAEAVPELRFTVHARRLALENRFNLADSMPLLAYPRSGTGCGRICRNEV